jgi:hypothetical protein
LLDGPALQHLQNLGLADLAGFEIAGTRDHDTIERFTDDPLNGPHVGWCRDCRPSFWRTNAFILRAISDRSRTLAELIDFQQKSYGPVMGVTENRLGGRVAVLGYYPWTSLQNLSKSTQMKNLCRWLSRDALPVCVDSFHKIALWCRRDAAGRPVVPLLNASLDTARGVRIQVHDTATAWRLERLDGRTDDVQVVRRGTGDVILELPPLTPWEVTILTSETDKQKEHYVQQS